MTDSGPEEQIRESLKAVKRYVVEIREIEARMIEAGLMYRARMRKDGAGPHGEKIRDAIHHLGDRIVGGRAVASRARIRCTNAVLRECTSELRLAGYASRSVWCPVLKKSVRMWVKEGTGEDDGEDGRDI